MLGQRAPPSWWWGLHASPASIEAPVRRRGWLANLQGPINSLARHGAACPPQSAAGPLPPASGE